MVDKNLNLHLNELKGLLQQFKKNNEILEKEKSSFDANKEIESETKSSLQSPR